MMVRTNIELRILSIVNADTDDFLELVKIAELDPSKDFRFANLSGVNFSDLDLTGFDFTGTCIEGCRFRDAKISDAVFTNAFGEKSRLETAADWAVFSKRVRISRGTGKVVLRHSKARRDESWGRLEKSFEKGERVSGHIFNQVKGGFTVDLDGAVAFLPRSQVDIRPVRDVTPLMHTPQPFQILKMDKRRGNIVVSRRTVLEETRAEQRSELVQSLEEGQIIDGVVKNITDYGAFVDLGGIDGLLHVTDIAWRRINHPTEVLSIGQTVKVQIIRVNHETHRISLGMKQLEADPWDGIEAKYPVDVRYKGRVTNITDYGAFVELEPGIEGLIHVSEMSWTKKNVHPGKIVSTSQEVEVMILEVDPVKRRISLGLKQTVDNPWDSFAESYPKDSIVEGKIKNKTQFGLFIGLEGDVDGMVHLSDLDWNEAGEQAIEQYSRGDMVKAVVLDVDVEMERISLGIKQAGVDRFAAFIRKGSVVTCEVIDVRAGGIDAKIANTDLTTFIRRSDLSHDPTKRRLERFAKGDRVYARITYYDIKNQRVAVSVKALEKEKEAVAEHVSYYGASLGDILGAALALKKKKATVAEHVSYSGASLGDILGPALKARDEGDAARRSQNRGRQGQGSRSRKH